MKRTKQYWLDRATDLLAETLSKWEDEEDSVQEEKADHIADLKRFFDEFNSRSGK